MKILSWNVRELGSLRKRSVVKNVLLKSQLDIVMLQESKLKEVDIALI